MLDSAKRLVSSLVLFNLIRIFYFYTGNKVNK